MAAAVERVRAAFPPHPSNCCKSVMLLSELRRGGRGRLLMGLVLRDDREEENENRTRAEATTPRERAEGKEGRRGGTEDI